MSPETLARMLGAANRCYRGRFGFSDLADLKETAKVWSAVLEEMEDAEGVAAFLEHCRHSVHPPTPADINDLVELTRVLEPQRCARCQGPVGRRPARRRGPGGRLAALSRLLHRDARRAARRGACAAAAALAQGGHQLRRRRSLVACCS